MARVRRINFRWAYQELRSALLLAYRNGLVVHDPRSDEDQQLVLRILYHVTTEQATDKRHVTQERHLVNGLGLLIREDAADNYCLTIINEDFCIDLVLLDREVRCSSVLIIRLILVDLDLHDDAVIRSNLRGHFKRQRRLLECNSRGAARARLLVWNLSTFKDLRGFLIGGDHLRFAR